jgi:hypothetical protein
VRNGGGVAGFGRGTIASGIAPFASFRLGSEEVRNTRLRIGQFDDSAFDMFIGADFFLSHHVYVANGQHKVYFTCNGGRLFDLTTVNPAAASAPSDASDGSDGSEYVAAPGWAG